MKHVFDNYPFKNEIDMRDNVTSLPLDKTIDE